MWVFFKSMNNVFHTFAYQVMKDQDVMIQFFTPIFKEHIFPF